MIIACYPRYDAVEDSEGAYYEFRYIPPIDSDKKLNF